jgi:hypothetical protein
LEEESTGFDPSGSARLGDVEDNVASERGDSGAASSSADTDLTSLSNGVRSLGVSEAGNSNVTTRHAAHPKDVETMAEDTKAQLLQEMFPDMNKYTILHTLRKCNGNWDRCMEELLNHTFFNDQDSSFIDGDVKPSNRSIDAFSDSSTHSKKQKNKRDKRKGRSLEFEAPTRHEEVTAPASAWKTKKEDVDFLSLRLNLPVTTITTLYNQNSLSLQSTLLALLDSPALAATAPLPASDPIVQIHAHELANDFSAIPLSHALTLIRLTHPSTSSAHELAKALTQPSRSHAQGIDHITPTYVPFALSLSDSEDSRSRTSSPMSRPHTSHVDPNDLHSHYNASASAAFNSASAAYRRGRSDKLMGGAAAYYSQVGRDYASLRTEASSSAADALVAAQSPRPREQVDLHGVTVKDAVRIAKARTEAWWTGKGGRGVMGVDGRIGEREAAGGFRIVTGVGRHSEGGRGKLGPAVVKMLQVEGWRISAGEGVVTVIGKGR